MLIKQVIAIHIPFLRLSSKCDFFLSCTFIVILSFVNITFKGTDKFVRVGGCKCEVREKDHAQNAHNVYTIKKYATVYICYIHIQT